MDQLINQSPILGRVYPSPYPSPWTFAVTPEDGQLALWRPRALPRAIQKSPIFFIKFWSHFGRPLNAKTTPKPPQNHWKIIKKINPNIQKTVFWELASRLHETPGRELKRCKSTIENQPFAPQTSPGPLSPQLAPRWLPDGSQNQWKWMKTDEN